MDIQSLYYFSELAKDLHMTRTAARLYISQQTLSNHIQRLEAYYGTQLLQRKPSLSLTGAGEAVLAFARLVIREQENLRSQLSDMEEETKGVIRFGASYLRTAAVLPDLLPAFSARYPQIELRLTNANSALLEPMVLDGRLDYAVILAQSGDIDPKLNQQHLMDDSLFLCMTDALLVHHYGKAAADLKEQAYTGAQVGRFAKLPFCTAANRVGTMLQKCFDEAQLTPNTYLADSDLSVSAAVSFQGLAACVLPKSSLLHHQASIPEDFNMFPLLYRNKSVTQSLHLISRKDCYEPRFAVYFRSLLVKQFQNLHQKEIMTDVL